MWWVKENSKELYARLEFLGYEDNLGLLKKHIQTKGGKKFDKKRN